MVVSLNYCRGTFLGVPIIRTIVYWGLYWGPLILGNYMVVSLNYCSQNGGNMYIGPRIIMGTQI